VIELAGPDSVTVECGGVYTELGATAGDVCVGDRTAGIVVNNPVNTAAAGVYTVTYDVSDGNGNDAVQATRTVRVFDTTAPVIELVGLASVTVECGASYTDEGATAGNVCAGDLTGSIVTVNPVNTAVPGAYTVSYSVNDGYNAAVEVTRTVVIVDTAAPVIDIAGPAAVMVECGTVYTDAGAAAMDACVGDLTDSVVTVNPVNSGVPGDYTVTYDVSDGNGNDAVQVARTVTVADTTAPVIELVGPAAVTTECGGTYTELGATATDNCSSGLIVTVGGDVVDNSVLGAVYTVKYNVGDGNGNDAAEVTRTVTVVDTTAPVIELLGPADITVECGGIYIPTRAQRPATCARATGRRALSSIIR